MLKRKIISQLEEWKSNHSHEALLIKGARQVGKTTIVRAFAKDNYTHFVEINFEKDPQAQEAFSGAIPKYITHSRRVEEIVVTLCPIKPNPSTIHPGCAFLCAKGEFWRNVQIFLCM